ncbi:MAG: DUF4293 domain-containing protein [Saprospiraceae bacterium]|nr:DUF4293 domain-containing protein [Saprospiraceae bacterium]
MIQRIQSIYLLLASIVSSTLFFFPFATGTGGSGELFADGNLDLNDNVALLILTIMTVVFSLSCIFLFKNRVLQMNVSKLIMLLILGLAGIASYFLFTSDADYTLHVGLFLPFLVVILLIMAYRGIKADESLVRSSDRIRD